MDELWLFVWETPDIKDQTANLWEKLKPFYQKLHAYVRLKLKAVFGDKMPKDNTIPAHLLGNMWAQQWSNIMNTVDGIDPYPDVTEIDVTKALENQVINFKIFQDFLIYILIYFHLNRDTPQPECLNCRINSLGI